MWGFWSVCRTSGRCQRRAHPAAALLWAHWTCHEPLRSDRYSSGLHTHSHSQIFRSARADKGQSSTCQTQVEEPYTHPEDIISKCSVNLMWCPRWQHRGQANAKTGFHLSQSFKRILQEANIWKMLHKHCTQVKFINLRVNSISASCLNIISCTMCELRWNQDYIPGCTHVAATFSRQKDLFCIARQVCDTINRGPTGKSYLISGLHYSHWQHANHRNCTSSGTQKDILQGCGWTVHRKLLLHHVQSAEVNPNPRNTSCKGLQEKQKQVKKEKAYIRQNILQNTPDTLQLDRRLCRRQKYH